MPRSKPAAEDDVREQFAGRYVSFVQLKVEVDRAEKVRYMKKELSLYSVFLLVFVLFVFLQQSVQSQFETKQAMAETFLQPSFSLNGGLSYETWDGVDTRDALWAWLDQVLIQQVLKPANEANNRFASYNLLLWGFRIRQLRVSNSSCNTPINLQPFVDTCYGAYSASTLDRTGFGNRLQSNLTGSDGTRRSVQVRRFEWQQAEATREPVIAGVLANYDGSGFVETFPLNASLAATQLAELRAADFFDLQTRAVVTSLISYNPNTNLFTSIELLVEFDPSGSVHSSASFRSLPLLSLPSATLLDSVVTMLRILFVLFVVYYIARFLNEWRAVRRISAWHAVDALSYGIFSTQVVFAATRIFRDERTELEDALASDSYYSINGAVAVELAQQELYAVNVMLCTVKLFKYLKLSKGLSLLFHTLSRAAQDIAYFFLVFSIMFIGFLLCGHLVFGSQLDEYRSVAASMSTLLRMLIGEVDYDQLREVDPVFAPLFFMAFMIMFYFILLNIFLAIILDAWQDVAATMKQEEDADLVYMAKQRVEELLQDLFRNIRRPRLLIKKLKTMLRKLRRRRAGRVDDSIDENLVLKRLTDWKKKRKNRHIKYLNFDVLKAALEGPKTDPMEVSDAQVARLLRLCQRHLLTQSDVDKLLAESSASHAETVKDMGLSHVKALQLAFSMLRDNQQRAVEHMKQQLDALRTTQTKTHDKIRILSAKLAQVVPHYE